MSLEYFAFLPSHRMPTRDLWQAALDAMALPLTLDPDLVPAEAGGFCPVSVGARPAGCEIDLEDAASLIDDYPLLAGQVDPTNSVLSFRLDGDEAEGACVFGLAAALVQAFGAVLYDPQGDTLLNRPDELEAQARTLLRAMQLP